MAVEDSEIEWTDNTWNPIFGCSKVSDGCKKCYAMRIMARLAAMEKAEPSEGKRRHALVVINGNHWNGKVVLIPETLETPLLWTDPRMIFVNSLSDTFHENLPIEHIRQVFDVIIEAHWHTFQILTKRAERLANIGDQLEWPENLWMGVSVENSKVLDRIEFLRLCPAKIKFLSIEPLLGPLPALDLRGIDWVIVGGESGPKCRPMDPEWVRQIRDQCLAQGVAFFFKQWGHIDNNPDKKDPTAKKNDGAAKGGCLLDGKEYKEFPKKKLR